MRWGLMGGTFDPIHLAHLRCAQEILEKYGLDRIIFIPSATPPLKQGPGITSYEHRERMVRFAVEGNPAFAFSDVENRREGRSYTVDTIGYFRETFGKGAGDLFHHGAGRLRRHPAVEELEAAAHPLPFHHHDEARLAKGLAA